MKGQPPKHYERLKACTVNILKQLYQNIVWGSKENRYNTKRPKNGTVGTNGLMFYVCLICYVLFVRTANVISHTEKIKLT